MTRNAATKVTALLAASLALLAPALAGDRALIDFIGFSADARYLAFEEFGVQDGSGFPYSNIYVLDLPADKWAAGSPFRVSMEDENATLQDARAEVEAKAAAALQQLQLTEAVDLVAVNGDGEMGDGRAVTFGAPGYFPNDPQGAYTLKLQTFSADSPLPCADWLGERAKGMVLTLTGPDGERVIHEDKVLPESRGCPSTYRIFAVVAPQYQTPPAGYAAIIAVYPFGFEGPDRRFIAVPLGN